MKRIYDKPPLLFEHGAPDGSSRPCSVSHAHWHLLPATIQAEDLLLEEYNWNRVDQPFLKADREYLLVGDGENSCWVAYSNEPIPSQVLRKRFAERLGVSVNWDWRSQPSVELMSATLDDFAS
jgi:hypothetical protein